MAENLQMGEPNTIIEFLKMNPNGKILFIICILIKTLYKNVKF